MSGRFRPPHDEEEDEEAAEGEQDAEDVDTVCRSIRPTIRQEERATAAGPRPAGHSHNAERKRERRKGETWSRRRDETRQRHTGWGGNGGERWRDLLGFIVDSAGLVAMCV